MYQRIGAPIIGVILVFILGGYVLLTSKNVAQAPTNPPPVKTIPVAAPAPVQTAPKDATADWETYQNKEMGFEIKYPADWKVEETTVDTTFYKGEKGPVLPYSPISPYGKTIAFSILERGKTCGDCSNYTLQETRKITINGYEAVTTIYNTSITSEFYIYSPAKDHVLLVSYGNPLIKIGEKDEKNDQLFKTMLSTFKFTK